MFGNAIIHKMPVHLKKYSSTRGCSYIKGLMGKIERIFMGVRSDDTVTGEVRAHKKALSPLSLFVFTPLQPTLCLMESCYR